MIHSTDPSLSRRDIDSTFNLNPEMYTSPAIYASEEKHIFSKEWIYACRADQVAKPGDYVTTEIAGAPLLIVCDKDGTVRAHSAVCRHRAAVIASGEGCAKTFRCPYHGWTYGMDGRLIGAPLMDRAKGFDRADYGLLSVRAEVWKNFVFVNLDPEATSLEERLAPLSARFEQYRMDEFRFTHSIEYTIRTNWKLYVENSMEEYHIPVTHPDSLQPLQPMDEWLIEPSGGAYEILLFPRAFSDGRIPVPSDRGESVAPVTLVYPNFVFSPSPGGMTSFDHKPVDVSHTKVKIDFFFRPETISHPDFPKWSQEYYEGLLSILREDNIILESTLRGMESPLSRRGRYSFREQVPHRLHNFVLDRLKDFVGVEM